MKYDFENGAVVLDCQFYEKAIYNVSNEKICATFDGSGAFVSYAEADNAEYKNKAFCSWHINEDFIDMLSEKKVYMLGRKQTVKTVTPAGILKSEMFLDKTHSGIFANFSVENRKDKADVTASLTFNNLAYLKFFSDDKINVVTDNDTVYFPLPVDTDSVTVYITFDKIESFDTNEEFRKAQREYDDELKSIRVPENLNEMEKALFYNTYYTVLENYKIKGDYRCFMAGSLYLLPMRSYYRDSYYTVLPMFNGKSELVKDQVITLARGISKDGNCPSAVMSDYRPWWGNHYDSPSFLAIMLYDYVRFTKDNNFLSFDIDGITIFKKAESAITKLSEFTDDTGLIYKEGPYNRRDWSDEVNRTGYVTYDEILFARALFSLSKMAEMLGENDLANKYFQQFEKVKNAINTYLWDETLGYYANYKNEKLSENNLSIDTVFACLWGIADDNKAKRMLKNMENILETKNNPEIKCKEFGVMNVYPFYKGVETAKFKSSQPFDYHNGSNWPYLSAMYALAKRKYGMEYKYALESWFIHNIENGNFTPIEYYSPLCKDGSLLHTWTGVVAFVLDERLSDNFWD